MDFLFFQVIFGTPLGAFCVKRFDMNGRQCAKFCCIILAISAVIFLGLMLHCREPTIGKYKHDIHDMVDLLIFSGTTHSMPVISTPFDDDFYDEPVIQADFIDKPCEKTCSM